MSNNDEHPEDRQSRIDGEEYARKHAEEFFAEHRELFLDVVRLYADGAAEDAFWAIREKFWARQWEPKKP